MKTVSCRPTRALPGRHANPFRAAIRADAYCPTVAKDGSSTRYT